MKSCPAPSAKRAPRTCPWFAVLVTASLLLSPGRDARCATSPTARGQEQVLLDGRVRVVARLERGIHGDDSPIVEVHLLVRSGAECFETVSYVLDDLPANPRELFRSLAGRIGWKGGYLFIRTECPGGNHWKCFVEEVFGFHRGHLVALGALGERDSDPDSVGSCYREGLFYDLDADWESASTGHAGAPYVELALRDAGGRLQADLDRTWIRNAARFGDNRSRLREIGVPIDAAMRFECAVNLYQNAVIAAYCDRQDLLEETLDLARARLDPGLFAEIQASVSATAPGALPRRSQPDVASCGRRR